MNRKKEVWWEAKWNWEKKDDRRQSWREKERWKETMMKIETSRMQWTKRGKVKCEPSCKHEEHICENERKKLIHGGNKKEISYEKGKSKHKMKKEEVKAKRKLSWRMKNEYREKELKNGV